MKYIIPFLKIRILSRNANHEGERYTSQSYQQNPSYRHKLASGATLKFGLVRGVYYRVYLGQRLVASKWGAPIRADERLI